MDLDTVRRQMLGNQVGGAMLLVGKLRVPVDIATKLDKLLVAVDNFFDEVREALSPVQGASSVI